MTIARLIGATALTGSLLLVPAAAAAQDQLPATSAAGAETGGSGEIVVTGSRIRRPNLDSTVPIVSLGGERLFEEGQNNVGEALNQLPQMRSTFSQQNPGTTIGVAGLGILDLRGLGTQRTLVLVNGRRHVAADIMINSVSPDVNSIARDLIERVDIVTGGSSAVYGSDAIAGVVNFILRRDFEGLQLRGSAGVTDEGFAGNQYLSALYGRNFAQGRGNVTVHGEYARQERVYTSQIPSFRTQNALFQVDSDPSGSDGNPDRILIEDLRSATINRFGLVPVNQTAAASACGKGFNGAAYNCTYLFNPDGTLTPQTGTRVGAGIAGAVVGGNGQTGREDQLFSVLPFVERYGVNLLGHYAFSDAAELFVEAKWNRVNAQGLNQGPTAIQGTQTQFDARERVRLDNPFLDPAARTTITSAILASGCNTSLTVTCVAGGTGALTAANQTAIANGSYRFVLARHLTDAGLRDEDFQRDTYRIVGGLRGDFNGGWNYELSINYGKFKERTTTYGYVDRQRFMLAIDAGRNPVTKEIQCRAKFDPASAVQFDRSDLSATERAAFQARLAADIAACVPYNPFGAPDNSASTAYFVYNASHVGTLDQLVVSGFVSGDSRQIFELPGGPVRFAAGGEYRREAARYQADPLVQAGITNAVNIPTFAPDPFKVKEAFAELQLPILKDVPLFHELSLSGAARVARYARGTGTVWAYNVGGEWAPVRDLRFRGNFSRAVRAPNLAETAAPLVSNSANNFQDPCSGINIGSGTEFRRDNCIAALGASLVNVTNLNAYNLRILSGSNPDLNAETSDSLTLGVVLQPRFIPGLSVSGDYYNIQVDGVITSASAQQVANGCYDAPDLNNPFCSLFTRFAGPGTGPSGELPGQILGNSLLQSRLNYAKQVRRGLEFGASYRTDLGAGVRLGSDLVFTHQLKNSAYTNLQRPTFENRILGELGDPVDRFRWNVDLSHGAVTIGYRMRYIGPMWTNAYEDFNGLQDRAPQDADYSDPARYPEVFYHDARVEWTIDRGSRDLKLYLGVDNLLDRQPPLGNTATTLNGAIYEFRGRNFYAGFKANF